MGVFEDVTKYCKKSLNDYAIRYLTEERELTLESINEWSLGYSPFELEGLVDCTDVRDLEAHKLVFKKDDSDYGSFVRNCVTFPFIDQYGKTITMSFRPLMSAEKIKERKLKKYWHPAFEKNRFLFGLHKAIPYIREADQVIIGEGQFDVILAHQHGIKNTVGVCGTALTNWHTSILTRYTSRIILVFDGDEAGEKSRKKIQERETPNVEIKGVTLPLGEDLDSYLCSFGAESFFELLSKAN